MSNLLFKYFKLHKRNLEKASAILLPLSEIFASNYINQESFLIAIYQSLIAYAMLWNVCISTSLPTLFHINMNIYSTDTKDNSQTHFSFILLTIIHADTLLDALNRRYSIHYLANLADSADSSQNQQSNSEIYTICEIFRQSTSHP